MKNILIIGSGISSLTMGVLLLKAGHKVRILEQHYHPGGYLHCFRRFGFKFETGGHYVGALGEDLPFHRLLKLLEVYHEEDYVELSGKDLDHYYFDDFSFSYAVGYDENIRRLSEQFPLEKDKIISYYKQIRESAATFPTYYYKSQYDQSLMMKYLEITLGAMLTSLNISGRLRQVLEAPCVLHGVSPDDVSFGVHSIMMDSITVSSHGFRDGGEKLAKRFVDKIKSLGGEVLLSHKVSQIEIENELVKKVVCENGAEFTADEYIGGIHPRIIFDMLGQENLRPAFRNRLAKISESVPFVGAYVVMKDSMGIDPKSNYYFMSSDSEGVFHPQTSGLHNQVGFFASPMRNYEGSGKFPLSIHATCPSGYFDQWKNETKKLTDPEYLEAKKRVFEPLLKKIDQRFEGFSSSILDVSYSSNLTNSRFNPSPNGSAYGLYHDLTITGARALGPRTHFANLYLTGQNSLFPGLLGASISGLRTSGFFTGLKDILRSIEYRS